MPRSCASAAVAATLTADAFNHPAARRALATVCRIIRASDLSAEHRQRLLVAMHAEGLPVLAIDLGC
jgi:hypothetical protein